ncbi:uncharacterized protein LOC116215672 isoform X2 [Punica granatum]|uniref:Uncharacterized protein LOC116215672 isoform X2 n=1 Tax=Punica granatum TaxID=22663 RepID=A0A6P8EKX4_PUNGR|nr:uncharacterized protein LOC116215672 isoform X2 [Punica granatum]
MASKENPEHDPTSTGTGDETIVAARRKRLRRVSFADVEITSVHIFKRDEDYSDSTPPYDPKPDDGAGRLTVGDGLGLFRDLGDHSDDSKELNHEREDEEQDDSEEEAVGRGSFFRPIESPSPGSSTVGSAVSNDEDNFFGPVSASFIRPGRLSDSAASDENHDVTMDSTAFSMHFRSLARSESGGDLKTPSRAGLGFEEKTLTQDAAEETNQGSLMVMTNARKLNQESSLPLDKFRSGGNDSNEMSLVGENQHRYDYGRLSPSLDALLAGGNEDLHWASVSLLADLNSLSGFDENRSSEKDLIDFGDEAIVGSTHDTDEVISAADVEVQEANPIQQVMKDVSNRNDWSASMPEYKSISTPEQLIKGHRLIETEVEMDGLTNVSRGTPQSNVSRFLELDVTAPQGSAYGRSSEEYPKENFPGNRILRVDKSDRMTESPFSGSISSISAKRREIFSYAATSPAKFSNLTALPAQSASSTSKESAKHGLSLSSIQKSISRFRNLDTSPSTSAVKNGIETLKLQISNYLSANSPHNTARLENSIEVPSEGAHAPDDAKEVDYKRMFFAGSNGIAGPHNIETFGNLEQNREITLAMEPGEPHVDLYTSISSSNDIAKDVPVMISSPSKVSWSGPISDKFPNIALRASEVGSSLMNVALDHRKDDGDASVSSELLISPMKETNQKPSMVKFYHGGISAQLNQQHQLNDLTGVNSEENQTSREIFTSAGCSTPSTDKLQLFSSGLRTEDQENLDLLPVSALKDLPSENNGADIQGTVLAGDDSVVSTSLCPHGRTEESPFEKSPPKKPAQSPRKIKLTQSPSLRELLHSLPADVQSHPREEIASSPSKLNCIGMIDCQKESCYSERPFAADDCKESSSRKRRSEEVVPGDECHTSKISRTTRSFEGGKSNRHDTNGYIKPSNERKKLASDVPPRDRKDIGMFEETLDYLQKVRNYDILSSDIQSQGLPDQFSNASQRRSAETLLLLQKLVYEKARLQLCMVRQDRLQEVAKKLSAGVEESQNLRRIYMPVEKGDQPDHDCHLCSTNSKLKNKDAYYAVTSMRQECDVLDEKVRSLSNSLLAYCKIKDGSSTNDMASLEDSLRKRMYSRLVRQNLQPWEIAEFGSSSNHHNISLDYLGFICQSVSVTAYPVPSFTVSNELEDTMIERAFPNMDASKAFAYVFSGEATKETISSRRLAHKTQTTHFLLRNLLEVVEEVQQARLEIKNLICTTFHSSSGGHLDLLLSFLDFNSDQKVTVTLDMTCLNRGIYPYEVLPDHTKVCTNRMPQSLGMEIRAAARSLPFGHQRIMRLSRCVSKLVESSTS